MLSDFGIVKRVIDSQRLMLSGQVIGTPLYVVNNSSALATPATAVPSPPRALVSRHPISARLEPGD